MTLNRGQTCIAVRRIFVQRARYAEFVAALASHFLRMARTDEAGEPRSSGLAKRLIGDAVERAARCSSSHSAAARSPPKTPARG